MILWFVLALLFHWRFQFSIRSLLVLTVAVAIPCSWLAVEMKNAKEQREAWIAIERLAGDAVYDSGGRAYYGDIEIDQSGKQIEDSGTPGLPWLGRLIGKDFFKTIVEVKLGNGGLEHLDALPSIQRLNLSYYVTTSSPDAPIAEPAVTDAELVHLDRLVELRELNLSGTNVSDAGMKHLERLTKLQEVVVSYTNVTHEGVQKLQVALPNCKISPCP
jgi:hypothetical protein